MAGTLLRRSVALLGQRLSSSGNLGLLSVNGAAVPAASFIPYEESRRSGYKSKIKVSKREAVVKGMGMVKEEMQKLKDETLGLLRMDKLYMVEHGDYEVVWRFNDKASINKWVLTCDNDNNEGRSQAEFVLGPDQKGIFRGYLNTTVPKDGAVVRAGYANIKSLPNMKSFQRKEPFDWTEYTHLVIKCRGDGRPYQLVLHMDRYFDVMWNDTYQFALYTRGGPYWQIAKIPFSKFFLASRGRIQDKQGPIELDKVLSMGITIADSVKGPFQLEIDYIALVVDKSHNQEFAYEMYKVPASHLY